MANEQPQKKPLPPQIENRDPNDVVILVRNNGPFRVYGPARMIDVNGTEYTIPPGDWFTLCRCGLSSKKPFCDSTHKTCEPPFDAPSDATA
jgi:CDGSH-type Zn-finger protein